MGIFGNIFERKNCDICGKQTNIFGGTKLENGRLCKDCANKLSPHLSGLKHLTVDDIRDHLAYREENAEKVKAFAERLFTEGGPAVDQVTKLFGEETAKRLILRWMYGVDA